MRHVLKWNWNPIALRLRIALALTLSAACLTACANWQQAVDDLKAQEVQITAAEVRARELPEVPKEIQACLDKNACASASKNDVAKACRTADGIVLEQKKVIKELRACGKTLLDWYAKIKAAEVGAKTAQAAPDAPADEANGHPRSGRPAKKRDADWP